MASIAGAVIPADGTYYLRVNDYTADTASERPYDLYLDVESGTPVPESELNETAATAQALPASTWVSAAEPDDTYNVSSNQDLLSPSISLAARTGPIVVSWWQWFQMESANARARAARAIHARVAGASP